MTHTIEVEVQPDGTVRPLASGIAVPSGKAYLTWADESDHTETNSGAEMLLLSESAFADWLSPEEDEAWAYLQREK